MAIVDLTNVQSTQIKPIRFDDFFLPLTFRVERNRLPRRLQSDPIQRKPGVLQQDTYENARRIQISGQVYNGQVMDMSCDDLIDSINGAINTIDDGRLCLRDDRFYNARVSTVDREYVEGTNRGVAKLSYEFVVSDPYEYSLELYEEETLNVSATNNDPVTLTNNGNTETPLAVIVTVDTSNDVRSVGIRFYEDKDDLTQITAVMIIDSLGQRVTDSSYYFKHRDKLTFDSAEYQLVYTDDSENTNISILDYARTSAEYTAHPVKVLPINLQTGDNKLGVYLPVSGDTGTVDVLYCWRDRWI